jgi:4-amino-4-deoxy-L-arabinose transferase-like glycosyltransferase
LWAVVAAVVVVRAIGISQPLLGNFATKQTIYAMIARNWALGRAPLWQPTIDRLTDGQRSWHLPEWPATAYFTSLGWGWFGGSLDVWGRSVGIACSAVAVVFAYLLARRWFGETAARATSLAVGFAPLSIAYGRGMFLEPSLVAYSFAAVYAMDTWLRGGRWAWLVVSAIAVSLAIATKIYMVLLAIPLVILACRAPLNLKRSATACSVFAATLTPTAAWYVWMHGVPATTGPAADFHPVTLAKVHAWPHPLLASRSFYFDVLGDLGTVAFTPVGLTLLVIGCCDRRFRPYGAWLAASFGLILLLPLKFHAANYYYLILLPPAALAVGVGWARLHERFDFGPRTSAVFAACGLLLAARYAIGPGYKTHDEDRSVTAAAATIRELAAPEEAVVTLHGSSNDLLYYCDRPGWALNLGDPQLLERIEAARRSGAVRLVVAHIAGTKRNADFTAWRTNQPVEAAGDDWQIVRLEPPPGPQVAAASRAGEFRSPPAPRTVAR